MAPAAAMLDGAVLPRRAGERPRTDPRPPHTQLDQLVPAVERAALSAALIAEVGAWEGVTTGGSLRAPPGTVGFHLPDGAGCAAAFLLGREFAHVHVTEDASLHAILREPLREQAITAGWAEPHPFAGQPTVSPDTVMLYAPRDADEVATIAGLVRRSWAYARG